MPDDLIIKDTKKPLHPEQVEYLTLTPLTESELFHQLPKGRYRATLAMMGYKRRFFQDTCCKTCINQYHISHNDKTYNKCRLIGDSRSSATDIRGTFVCKKWEQKKQLL